ncbi:MAG: acetyltransferase [Proteobacteria bacterium]|nr:acetyltransferase [Pseudomonadota bacterium]
MTATTELYVLCAGGHARVLIDILRRAGKAVTGLTDDDAALHGTTLDDVPIIGDQQALLMRGADSRVVVNALGNKPRTGDAGMGLRRGLFTRFKEKGFRFETVISPDASVSARALLNEGVQVVTGAIVHPGCLIGANTIINTGAQIDHDCRIGDHCHIAPAAILCGEVTVGEECHVGAGAVVVPGVTIGAGAVIGAGATVVTDIPPGATVLGKTIRTGGERPTWLQP